MGGARFLQKTMKITNLEINNLKGLSGSWRLGPVTLICGANFVHKTTIPLACRLALAGYLPPPIGTRRIYDLAGNPTGAGFMAINLALDNGSAVNWKWNRSPEGKVTTEGGLGGASVMPEYLLDPRKFFAQTGKEQIQTILDICKLDGSEWSVQAFMKELQQIEINPLEKRDLLVSEIGKYLYGMVDGRIQDKLNAIKVYLESEVKKTKEAMKAASESIRSMRAQENKPAGQNADELVPTDPSEELKQALALMGDDGSGQLIGMLQSEIAKLPAGEFLQDTIETLQRAVAELPEIDEEEELEGLQVKWAKTEQTHGNAVREVGSLSTMHARIESAEECPTCGATRKGWKNAKLTEITKNLGIAIAARDKAESDLVMLKARMNELDSAIELRSKLATATEQKRKLDAMRAQVTELQAKVANDDAGLRETIQKLQERKVAYGVYQERRKMFSTFGTRLEDATTRKAVFSEALERLVKQQEKIIGGAFAEVLKVARYFTDGLINSPLEFSEGELGRRVSEADRKAGTVAPVGAWIPFDTFSGTEELLALAGFSVAITKGAQVQLIVLDELGRLDPTRKLNVAMRMSSLVNKGVIDQAILIDVDAKPYMPLVMSKSVTLIQL